MLDIAAGKTSGRIPLIEGDALDLPFRDGTFDAATIAFGLRNLSNLESGLAELSRVLKPGGWVAVLERCDAVLAGGQSAGVARELERAAELGIPVMHSVEKLGEWMKAAVTGPLS